MLRLYVKMFYRGYNTHLTVVLKAAAMATCEAIADTQKDAIIVSLGSSLGGKRMLNLLKVDNMTISVQNVPGRSVDE